MTLRRRWSICALVLGLGLCTARAQTGASWQQEWVARFNRERARAGAPPLRLPPVLSQVAQRQADEMARSGRHLRSPAARTVTERLLGVGYSAHDWREYYALSDETPGDALAAMRAARDGRFRDLGLGAATLGGTTLYVFVFGQHQGDYFAAATAPLHDRPRIAAELLRQVNAIRSRFGAPPLLASPVLDRVSQEHAEDMLHRAYSGHRTPEGLGPSDRAGQGGYPAGIGENIVEQRYSVAEAVDAWLSSPEHRRNLLDPTCREMGLGLAVGEGYDAAPGGYRVIWVQSLGQRMP